MGGHRRKMSWTTAVSDMKDDRIKRPEVRVERLRRYSTDGSQLWGWRGRSERRYVFAQTDLCDAGGLNDLDVVVLAVRWPDGAALPEILSARAYAAGDANYPRWLAEVIARGATEIHVHRLAAGADARAAVAADLRPLPLAKKVAA